MRVVVCLSLAIGLAGPSLAASPTYLGSFGTGGSGTDAVVNPVGLALAPDGTLWVALAGLHKAKHFTASGTYLGETVTPISTPTGVAVLSTGEIVVSSSTSVSRYAPDGSGKLDLGVGGAYAVVARAAGGFWATQQSLHRMLYWPELTSLGLGGTPAGFAVGPDGAFYVANSSLNRIDVTGGPGPDFSWGSTGSGPGQFSGPSDVEIAGGLVLVADTQNNRIQVFHLDGTFVSQFGTAGTAPGQILRPSGLAVATDGTIFVSELSNNRISHFGDVSTAACAGSWGRLKSLFR